MVTVVHSYHPYNNCNKLYSVRLVLHNPLPNKGAAQLGLLQHLHVFMVQLFAF